MLGGKSQLQKVVKWSAYLLLDIAECGVGRAALLTTRQPQRRSEELGEQRGLLGGEDTTRQRTGLARSLDLHLVSLLAVETRVEEN